MGSGLDKLTLWGIGQSNILVHPHTIYMKQPFFQKKKKKNHDGPVNQENWCNMNFTVTNLFPLIHALVWPESSPNQVANPGTQNERQTTQQMSYPSPVWNSPYLCIRSSTSTASSGLDTKHVIKESTYKVVMNKQSSWRVSNHEGEDGKAWHFQIA